MTSRDLDTICPLKQPTRILAFSAAVTLLDHIRLVVD